MLTIVGHFGKTVFNQWKDDNAIMVFDEQSFNFEKTKDFLKKEYSDIELSHAYTFQRYATEMEQLHEGTISYRYNDNGYVDLMVDDEVTIPPEVADGFVQEVNPKSPIGDITYTWDMDNNELKIVKHIFKPLSEKISIINADSDEGNEIIKNNFMDPSLYSSNKSTLYKTCGDGKTITYTSNESIRIAIREIYE